MQAKIYCQLKASAGVGLLLPGAAIKSVGVLTEMVDAVKAAGATARTAEEASQTAKLARDLTAQAQNVAKESAEELAKSLGAAKQEMYDSAGKMNQLLDQAASAEKVMTAARKAMEQAAEKLSKAIAPTQQRLLDLGESRSTDALHNFKHISAELRRIEETQDLPKKQLAITRELRERVEHAAVTLKNAEEEEAYGYAGWHQELIEGRANQIADEADDTLKDVRRELRQLAYILPETKPKPEIARAAFRNQGAYKEAEGQYEAAKKAAGNAKEEHDIAVARFMSLSKQAEPSQRAAVEAQLIQKPWTAPHKLETF
jgi:ABC-type transporter Mla subunit MlaD